jgi:FtsH-binding integral membrane protein
MDKLYALHDADPGIERTAAESRPGGYLLQVCSYMAAGLLLTGVVAYYGAASGVYASVAGTAWFWLPLLASLALVFLVSFWIERMSLGATRLAFWAYAALVGLSLSGIFPIYAGEGVARVFFVSVGTFAATSLYGYTTRADLAIFGSFLFMSLIGVVLATLVNVFLKSSALQLTVSVIGVFVFAGLTAHDAQRIRRTYIEGEEASTAAKQSILQALALCLYFLNPSLMLVRLMGNR